MNPETGFLPSTPPLRRLPDNWRIWEDILGAAQASKVQLGERPDLTEAQQTDAESWRSSVRKMPLLSPENLLDPEELRRSHHVLAFILHFYIHSLHPDAKKAIAIPSSLGIPLLRISKTLDIPPVLTYWDANYYNWGLRDGSKGIAVENLRGLTLFTGTPDEEAFHLTPALMELQGAGALRLLASINDTIALSQDVDDVDSANIIEQLQHIPPIFTQVKEILFSIRGKCNPDLFYREIRPWLPAYSPSVHEKPWIWEGIEEDTSLEQPVDLGGVTAGQSCMFRAFDLLLGVDGGDSGNGKRNTETKREFIDKMIRYMYRSHRGYILHLYANPPPLRAFVDSKRKSQPQLGEAYNSVLQALKELRDAHIIIVTSFIVQPARRLSVKVADGGDQSDEPQVKGTGGSDVMNFLKGIRDGTAEAILRQD